MEIIKSPEGNYHIAANKDEWFLIHFYANFLNDNYDKIDEFIFGRFDAQEEVASITDKINKAHIADRDENYLTLNFKELHLLVDILADAADEQAYQLNQFSDRKMELRYILSDTTDKLFYFYIEQSKEKKKNDTR